MLHIGLSNIRRLKHVAPVEIRPITLLLGRNTSGKSTFLRTIPLLRQSLMTRTSSPILWYGDLVDIGSFQGAVSDNDTSNPIVFTFKIDRIDTRSRPRYYYDAISSNTIRRVKDVTYSVSLVIGNEKSQSTRISEVRVGIEDELETFRVCADERGRITELYLHGNNIINFFKGSKIVIQSGSIFPELFSIQEADSAGGNVRRYDDAPIPAQELVTLFRPYLDKRIQTERLLAICSQCLSIHSWSAENLRAFAERTQTKSFIKLIERLTSDVDSPLAVRAKEIYEIGTLLPIINAASSTLQALFTNSLYIGPARAKSERYYRYQDLSVSDIDPDGKNFPMFLNSLSASLFDSFSKWVEKLFNFGVRLRTTQGHISIELTDGAFSTNVVDTGYGVSQILPVLGQLWWANNRGRQGALRVESSSILAIEQPELHLHPAHQALLGDALVDALDLNRHVREEGETRYRTFLVETHSETLINRMGQLVEQGKISPDLIQILIFEPDEKQRMTNVSVANFDTDGTLQNWPYGFFQPAFS